MIAIDTNILVRLFVDDTDSPEQMALVGQLVAQQEAIYVSQVVQVELVWVLESAYDFEKSEVLAVLQAMYDHSAILLEYREQFFEALRLFIDGSADFSDYVIFVNAKSLDYPFWTFDKKLARTPTVFRLIAQNLSSANFD